MALPVISVSLQPVQAAEKLTIIESAETDQPSASGTAAPNAPTPNFDRVNQVSDFNSTETKLAPGMAQVTSVSQLSDVKPTDWAFQALQSLVERYGCWIS